VFQEFVALDGLLDVVGHAALEAFHHVADLAPSGNDDDRGFFGELGESGEEAEPVKHGHAQVQKDQGGAIPDNGREALAAVAGDGGAVAGAGKPQGDGFTQ
jgi:hypothetical protein